MMRIADYIIRLGIPFGRFFGGGRSGGDECHGEHTKEMGHFSSSWGRWPGHEANFPVLGRMLWEIGKSRERACRDEDREEDRPARHDRSG